jgi:hypothetical protein
MGDFNLRRGTEGLPLVGVRSRYYRSATTMKRKLMHRRTRALVAFGLLSALMVTAGTQLVADARWYAASPDPSDGRTQEDAPRLIDGHTVFGSAAPSFRFSLERIEAEGRLRHHGDLRACEASRPSASVVVQALRRCNWLRRGTGLPVVRSTSSFPASSPVRGPPARV